MNLTIDSPTMMYVLFIGQLFAGILVFMYAKRAVSHLTGIYLLSKLLQAAG